MKWQYYQGIGEPKSYQSGHIDIFRQTQQVSPVKSITQNLQWFQLQVQQKNAQHWNS